MLDGTVSNDAPIVDFWPMEAPRVRDAASNACVPLSWIKGGVVVVVLAGYHAWQEVPWKRGGVIVVGSTLTDSE